MRRSPFGSILLGPADQSATAMRVRVQLLLTALLITTNLVGAAVVFLVSTFVVPTADATDATRLSLAIAVPVYVGLAVIVGAGVGTSLSLRALRWATQATEPDAGERTAALQVPTRLTLLQSLLWLGGATLFTVLAVLFQPDRALSTGLTVVIAGMVVSAVAYLLAQFALRPVAARALADQPVGRRPRGAGVGAQMVIFWSLGTGMPIVGLVVAAILALTGDEVGRTRLAVIALVIAGTVLVFGSFITVLNARAVVAPVLSVSDALLDVERGDLDVVVQVYDGTELGLLQAGFNRMAAGLREREHLRDLFGRHVGREVAEAATEGSADVRLGGETREVSVLFVDLVGSTAFATEHSPEEVVEMLNRFFGVVVDEVDQRRGLVNKFVGDAVLAVFGAPVAADDHAGAALASARAMARRLAEEVPEVEAGIGVATGQVVAGNVGHASRFEYTVVGDAVNSAARLADLAKEDGRRPVATWSSVEAADEDEAGHWERHGAEKLRGRSEETELAIPRES